MNDLDTAVPRLARYVGFGLGVPSAITMIIMGMPMNKAEAFSMIIVWLVLASLAVTMVNNYHSHLNRKFQNIKQ